MRTSDLEDVVRHHARTLRRIAAQLFCRVFAANVDESVHLVVEVRQNRADDQVSARLGERHVLDAILINGTRVDAPEYAVRGIVDQPRRRRARQDEGAVDVAEFRTRSVESRAAQHHSGTEADFL